MANSHSFFINSKNFVELGIDNRLTTVNHLQFWIVKSEDGHTLNFCLSSTLLKTIFEILTLAICFVLLYITKILLFVIELKKRFKTLTVFRSWRNLSWTVMTQIIKLSTWHRTGEGVVTFDWKTFKQKFIISSFHQYSGWLYTLCIIYVTVIHKGAVF